MLLIVTSTVRPDRAWANEPGEAVAGLEILLDEPVEGEVFLLCPLVVLAGMEIPANDKRAREGEAIEPPDLGLLLERRHSGVRREARDRATVEEARRKGFADERRITDLQRERRTVREAVGARPWQRRHEGHEAGGNPRHVGEQHPAEGGKLKHDRAEFGPQAGDRRGDADCLRCGGVEERGIVATDKARVPGAFEGIGDRCRRLDDEPEVIGHRRGVGGVFVRKQRGVEGAIEAHAAEEGMLRVGRQAPARQTLFALRLAVARRVDEAGPAGERPARCAEVDLRREPGGKGVDVCGDESRRDRLGARGLSHRGFRERVVVEQRPLPFARHVPRVPFSPVRSAGSSRSP